MSIGAVLGQLPAGAAGGITGVEGAQPTKPAAGPQTDFGESFQKALGEARDAEQHANQSAVKFANGDPSVGIHEVVIASEKANIAVRYATTLKNKAVEAYRELMNTQV
jgi:flagellar hook-basal body complex protein FliE